MLRSGLIQADALKAYFNELNCCTYPDVQRFEAEQTTLESQFPTYSEVQEGRKAAGECHLGHLPHFVRQDAAVRDPLTVASMYASADSAGLAGGQVGLSLNQAARSSVPPLASADSVGQAAGPDERVIRRQLSQDALTYSTAFRKCQQYLQSRCQHHIHRRSAATGERVIPNACQCTSKPKESGIRRVEAADRTRQWSAILQPVVVRLKSFRISRGVQAHGV